MYIISVYDISTIDKAGKRRLVKTMKTFRRYLSHTQRSVFEGEITEAKFRALKLEIGDLIKESDDYVVFYRVDNANNLKRESLGIDYDPTSTII